MFRLKSLFSISSETDHAGIFLDGSERMEGGGDFLHIFVAKEILVDPGAEFPRSLDE